MSKINRLLMILLLILTPSAFAEGITITGATAQILYDNLDIEPEFGIKSFNSSDHLIKIECITTLYQPICELIIVSTVEAGSWEEFKKILNGSETQRDGQIIKFDSNKLSIHCQNSCDIFLRF